MAFYERERENEKRGRSWRLKLRERKFDGTLDAAVIVFWRPILPSTIGHVEGLAP